MRQYQQWPCAFCFLLLIIVHLLIMLDQAQLEGGGVPSSLVLPLILHVRSVEESPTYLAREQVSDLHDWVGVGLGRAEPSRSPTYLAGGGVLMGCVGRAGHLPTYLARGWGGMGQCLLPPEQNDRHLWKHYLPSYYVDYVVGNGLPLTYLD